MLYRRGNFSGPMDQMICDALRLELDAQIALSPGFRWGSTLLAGAPITMPANGNGHGQNKIVPMAELERQTILSAIAELNGDKLQAARLLGIGKTTLYRKLKDYAAQI